MDALAQLVEEYERYEALMTDEERAEVAGLLDGLTMRLRDFLRQAWPIIEPATEFAANWHHDAICDHLEAVSRSEIRRLLITLPPRHTKSICCSVVWPAWLWTWWPEARFFFVSYADTLSTELSLHCRRIVESDWYRRRWGATVQVTTDQNTKTFFENTRTGKRLSSSVGGQATGLGGDFIVCDDPHSAKTVHSDVVRRGVITWWRQTMSSRVNDPKKAARVVIMQRLHYEDMGAHLMSEGDYVHLDLPSEYIPTTFVSPIGWSDPRTEPGQLLWPDRFGKPEIEQAKKDLGVEDYAAQHQQRPLRHGARKKFQAQWFEIVEASPADARRVRYWDQAATEPAAGADPDWTAGARVAEKDGIYFIEDMRRGQLTPKGVEDLTKQTAELDGLAVPIGIEQEPGASGKNTIDHYRRIVLKGRTVFAGHPTGNKELRANPWSAAAEAGNVKIVKGAWNKAFLDECEGFPHGDHDDQVDAVSGAVELIFNLSGDEEWDIL